MAVSDRFNRALRNLMARFRRHADASRSVESVPELARRRADLEDARVEMRRQREADGLTAKPPRRSPRWVDPAAGAKPASRVELVGVFVAAVIVLGVLGAATWAVYRVVRSYGKGPVTLVASSVTERLEPSDPGRCVWTIAFQLELDPTAFAQVLAVDVDRTAPSHSVTSLSRSPSRTTPDRVAARLAYEFFDCPSSVEEIDHGPLEVTYRLVERGITRVARLDL